MFTNVLSTCFVAFRRLFRRVVRLCNTSNLARRINDLRAFFRFIQGRMSPITSKGSRCRDRISLFSSSRISNRVFFRLRKCVTFIVIDEFAIKYYVGTRRKRVTAIAKPRPIVNIDSRLSSKEEEDTCRASIFVSNLCGRMVTINSMREL